MGDRTSVTLYVMTSQADAAKAICGIYAWDEEDTSNGLYSFTWEDVNYGDLSCEKALQKAGIAYDKEWGHGDGYGPGTQYCRYTSTGELILLDTYDSGINPDLDQLIERIDKPSALRAYILEHVASVSPLPWDNQEEYAKVFKAKQLITVN